MNVSETWAGQKELNERLLNESGAREDAESSFLRREMDSM